MITLAALALAAAVQSQEPMLVSAEWLVQHQRDPNLVLLHVGARSTYDGAHIDGVHYLAFNEIYAPPDSTKPPYELPTPDFLDSVLEAKGISDHSRIVIYSSDDWGAESTRAYLTLYWAGLGGRTSLLDGAEAIALIDARNARFFQGNTPAHPDQARGGHIPGASNIESGRVFSGRSKLFRRHDELVALFRGAHADAGDTVVAYCHIGAEATTIWFAAKLAGYDARLYDGSFAQWSNLAQYAVEH